MLQMSSCRFHRVTSGSDYFLVTPPHAQRLGTHFTFHRPRLYLISNRRQRSCPASGALRLISTHLVDHQLSVYLFILAAQMWLPSPTSLCHSKQVTPPSPRPAPPPSTVDGLICCHRLTQALRAPAFKLSARRLHTCRRLLVEANMTESLITSHQEASHHGRRGRERNNV